MSSPRLYSLRPEGGAADATLAGGHTVTIRADTRTPHCEGVAPAAKDEGESAGTSAAFKTSSYLLAPSVLRWVRHAQGVTLCSSINLTITSGRI